MWNEKGEKRQKEKIKDKVKSSAQPQMAGRREIGNDQRKSEKCEEKRAKKRRIKQKQDKVK